MVDISGKIAQIKKMIDNGSYFTINRARQYGKTTTLYEIRRCLAGEYLIIKISFEGLGDESFASPDKFCPAFLRQIISALESPSVSAEHEYIERWADYDINNFELLSRHITKMCRDKKIVLLIDEVDRTSNNNVFLQFLSMLRKKYLARDNGDDCTFYSVVLAGVYDIKNIKFKMINEGLYTLAETEGKIYNSPWNIAENFDVDMSFSPAEIATMLQSYETDHNTGMDIAGISDEIYNYTSGYPFLVSRLCQLTDEKLNRNWTAAGIAEAVQILLEEANTLFDDMFKNIRNYTDLRDFLYDLLFVGKSKSFNIYNELINLGHNFGFFKNANGKTHISNKIFETCIYNYFVSLNELKSDENRNVGTAMHEILKNGAFDMELCLRKFAAHYKEIFSGKKISFLERHGRLLFLSYLKPFINGDGFYHVESEINDFRMDLIVDYKREQFIVELKIWRGEKYEQMAYEQLADYMKIKNAEKSYLLTFDFRKESNKSDKAEWIEIDGKQIFEIFV